MGKGVFKKVAVVAGLAAAAGFLTGLLTAPKSGKETRDDIKNAAKSGLAEAERELKKLSTELGEVLDDAAARTKQLTGQAKQDLVDLGEKAQNARAKAREVLSAVHEGDAEDEDLKSAVHQASSALKHLRDYLQK